MLTINLRTTDVCSRNNFCNVPGASQGGSASGRSQAWTLPAAGDQCWAPRLAGQVLTLTILWEAEPWAAQTGPGRTLARRPGWRQNCENRPSLSTAHRRLVSTALSRELTEPQPRCQPVPPVPWHVLWADPTQGRPEAASMQAEDTATNSLRWRGLLVESHALHFCGCDTGPRHSASQIVLSKDEEKEASESQEENKRPLATKHHHYHGLRAVTAAHLAPVSCGVKEEPAHADSCRSH